ncbi:hypothetical protein OG889_04280 [Streptomyces sp. NBC_00481]|uniref:hypothetical protein n=1 Tax=Streptomyces sp. NBC_00481 TaxID=2975755 RepID=UPI002DD7DB23|nr:hypothetical protein [Streptomyces sp. NBC_00481]WRY94006.1 hypothetical protein OG889_04280 [Streptomyces sp. NBC_00481]
MREVAPIALVSNAATRLEWDLARLGLADLATTVVNTARIGIAYRRLDDLRQALSPRLNTPGSQADRS